MRFSAAIEKSPGRLGGEREPVCHTASQTRKALSKEIHPSPGSASASASQEANWSARNGEFGVRPNSKYHKKRTRLQPTPRKRPYLKKGLPFAKRSLL